MNTVSLIVCHIGSMVSSARPNLTPIIRGATR